MSTTVVETTPQPRRRNSPWLALVVVAVVLAGVGAWLYNRTRPVATVAAKRDIVAVAPGAGPVVAPPGESVAVMAPFTAPVQKVMTTLGDNVRKGDVLAELSLPDAEEAYNAARTQVQAAEATYTATQQAHRPSVSAAKERLKDAKRSEAQADSSSVTFSADGVQVGGTDQDKQQAEQERFAASVDLQRAQAARATDLALQREQLAAAQAAVNEARTGKKQTQVKSPIEGTVLALNAQPGVVTGNDPKVPVAVVTDLNALEVQARFPANYAGVVKPGKEAKLTVAQVPNEVFEGRVESVTNATQESLGGVVKKPILIALISVKNKGGQVKPGMQARVAVELGEKTNALAVPNDAITEDSSGKPVVQVLRGNAWQPSVVELGLTDGQFTEIKSGLKEGETIQVKKPLAKAVTGK